jgi:hypothetical protein
MSSTRTAKPGAPFRQERYASSPEFKRGLLANLVAARCGLLDSAEDRKLIWFIQFLSHQEGGLKALCNELLTRYGDRIGTASMHKFGTRAGQVYNAEQVRAIREGMPIDSRRGFMLRGDFDLLAVLSAKEDRHSREFVEENEGYLGGNIERRATRAQENPTSYPAADFLSECRTNAEGFDDEHPGLDDWLGRLCLDPELPVENGQPWYFPELVSCLRRYQADWVKARQSSSVVTEIGRRIEETLDYALESKCMVLIDGLARIGKTFSAKAWCAKHPGAARYVQVPSTNDDIGFYRAIAKAVGVSINLNSKAQELRQRIEEALQSGHLAVVFDEAHYLWPNTAYRDALPGRINWIMTALVNQGVSVALVTTPQFMRAQKKLESRSCWTSEQFIGRIGHYEKLPDSLAKADLEKVAKSLLPEGDSKTMELLVCYAQGSAKYLAGIESAVRRGRYLATRGGRGRVGFADIKRAIQESVIPSDSALAQALSEPAKHGRRRIHQPVINEPLTATSGTRLGIVAEPRERLVAGRDTQDFSDRHSRGDSLRIERELVPG